MKREMYYLTFTWCLHHNILYIIYIDIYVGTKNGQYYCYKNNVVQKPRMKTNSASVCHV